MSIVESEVSTRPTSGCPIHGATALGPIAPSYDTLHRIDLLSEAIASRGVPRASYAAATCAIFQAAQVCLLNIARMADRTRLRLEVGDVGAASRYTQWMTGFHRLMRALGLSMSATRGIFGVDASGLGHKLGIIETKGYQAFVEALSALDAAVKKHLIDRDRAKVRLTLSTKHLDDNLFRALHGLRIANHDATKWECDLTDITFPLARPGDELLSSSILAEAVTSTELSPDTFHGEFVALHQISEILCSEVNDQLEAAVRTLRANHLTQTLEHLSSCRALLEPIVLSQRVMAELLATSEYHEFRENLGPASGIHSLAIKQHMFGDLSNHFWLGIETWLKAMGEGDVEVAVCNIDDGRHSGPQAWLRHRILDEACRLHGAHQEWRHEHLHMPRNCLGSGGTKSMIGVPDGIHTVYKMRDAANANRALTVVHDARGLRLTNDVPNSPLARVVRDTESVDSLLMQLVGEATREYFPEVQKRSFQPFHSSAPERKP